MERMLLMEMMFDDLTETKLVKLGILERDVFLRKDRITK